MAETQFFGTGAGTNFMGYFGASMHRGIDNPDPNDYEMKKRNREDYLDNVMKYCEKEGITYGEFQRREQFGLIPEKVLDKLRPNVYKMKISQMKAFEEERRKLFVR